MENVNCPLILLISFLLSQVRSERVINLCNNWDDELSEMANTIIVETQWYLLSQVTQMSVQVYITQVGKMIGNFSIRIHLYFITGATTRNIWFIMSGRDLEHEPGQNPALPPHTVLRQLTSPLFALVPIVRMRKLVFTSWKLFWLSGLLYRDLSEKHLTYGLLHKPQLYHFIFYFR